MSTTVTAYDPTTTMVKTTTGSVTVLVANSVTGIVTSSILSARVTNILSGQLQLMLAVDPSLSAASAFPGVVQSLVYLSQLESSTFSVLTSVIGNTCTLSVSGLQSTSHVLIVMPYSTNSPFAIGGVATSSSNVLTGLTIINVKAAPYNATGNGDTNDTTAIQTAINVFSNSSSSGVLYFPAGTYSVTGLQYIGNPAYGITMMGDGNVSTASRIVYNGVAGGTCFEFRGMTRSTITNLNFDANNKADYAGLLVSNQPNGGGGTFYNTFKSCAFVNARAGASAASLAFGEPGPAYQVSEIDFYSCEIIGLYGVSANAVLQRNNGNAKNFRFFGGSCSNADVPFNFSLSSGSYTIHGVFIGGMKLCAIKTGPNGYFSIHGVEVETAGSDTSRFLEGTAGANGTACEVVGCDVNINTLADDVGIAFAGALTLTNNSFHNTRTTSSEFKVLSAAQPSPGTAGPGSVKSSGNKYLYSVDYAPICDSGGTKIFGPGGQAQGGGVFNVYSNGDYAVDSGGTVTRLRDASGIYTEQAYLGAQGSTKTATYTGLLLSSTSKWDFTFVNFQTAALFKDIDILVPPVGTGIVRVYISVGTGFAGTAGTLQLQLGDSVGGAELLIAFDAKVLTAFRGADTSALGTALTGTTYSQGAYVQTSLKTVKLRLTSSVGNLSGLNAGACTVYVDTVARL